MKSHIKPHIPQQRRTLRRSRRIPPVYLIAPFRERVCVRRPPAARNHPEPLAKRLHPLSSVYIAAAVW
jgi:hypothetical protein